MQELDLLILGAGWSSTFLIPLATERNLNIAATTRDGRSVAGLQTIKWGFTPDESSDIDASANQFAKLPLAKNVLITFPLTGTGQSKTLVQGYEKAHGKKKAGFIQLGSTGIWQIKQEGIWADRKSPYAKDNARAIAEDELLGLGGTVLNLAGLWGGERDPKTWVGRVAKTKEDVRGKKSLHMVHGHDVAQGILAVCRYWDKSEGQRWMLTDGFVYDWWSLMAGWADATNEKAKEDRQPADTAKWVYELMREEDVKALPRSFEVLGRAYDSREFWETFKLTPLRARI